MSTLWVSLTGLITEAYHSQIETAAGILEGGKLSDLNVAALRHGVTKGMTKREALSFSPHIALYSPKPNLSAFRMLEWLELARLYTSEIEMHSPADAFLSFAKHPDPVDSARLFLDNIERSFAYPYIAGISPTKWVAKALAGFPLVESALPGFSLAGRSVAVLKPLEPAIRERLHFLGYKRVKDVQELSIQTLQAQFGALAHHILAVANGSFTETVQTNYPPKSISAELVFEGGCTDSTTLLMAFQEISCRLASELSSSSLIAKSCQLTVVVESDTFAYTVQQAKPFRGSLGIQVALNKCLEQLKIEDPICKLLVKLPDLVPAAPKQRSFIGKDASYTEDALESVRHKYGGYAVHLGKEHKEPRRVHVIREWSRVSGWQ